MSDVIQIPAKDADLNAIFWHGTALKALKSILEHGLDPTKPHH